MSKTTVIAAPTTLTMYAEDVQIRDLETGALSDVTSPDSVSFIIRDEQNEEIEDSPIAGNQMESTNNFNAAYTYDVAGKYTWQAAFEVGDVVLTTRKTHVTVE